MPPSYETLWYWLHHKHSATTSDVTALDRLDDEPLVPGFPRLFTLILVLAPAYSIISSFFRSALGLKSLILTATG